MGAKWKQKLSSRKFWMAVAAWLTSILTSFGVSDNAIAQVASVVAGVGALAVYILAEAKVDANRPPDTSGDTQGGQADKVGF